MCAKNNILTYLQQSCHRLAPKSNKQYSLYKQAFEPWATYVAVFGRDIATNWWPTTPPKFVMAVVPPREGMK